MRKRWRMSEAKRRTRFRCPFKVKLSCGHEINARNEPLHPAVKLGCTAGLGCGYFLHWESWRNMETGNTGVNMYQPPSEDNEGDTMIPRQKE